MATENSVPDQKADVKQTEHTKLLYKKICRPKNWRPEINNVKQPCWCHEEWTDYHEDGNHGDVWVEVKVKVPNI